jgi:hypothetical protein
MIKAGSHTGIHKQTMIAYPAAGLELSGASAVYGPFNVLKVRYVTSGLPCFKGKVSYLPCGPQCVKNPPAWEKILHSKKHISDLDKNITKIWDGDGLFEEFIHIANIRKTRKEEWNIKILKAFERWSEIFEFVKSETYFSRKHNSFWNSLLPFLVLV